MKKLEIMRKGKQTTEWVDSIVIPYASIFTILDRNKIFYRIKFSKQSELVTTFNAEKCVRYCYRRSPYDLSSGPKVFHWFFNNILEGKPGVEMYIDDIIVWGSHEAEHEKRLE